LAEDALVAGGLTATPTPGWASAELDLSPDVDALRRGLRSKWRNTLNKAEREGVEVRSGSDDATFATFTEAYGRFLTERDFDTTVTPQLLTTLQRLQPADQRLTAFIAERDGELLGAALISRNGGRAEYLSGFVEEAGRSAGAGQILLWRSVVAMKEAGMILFDLGGMDPDITPRGIYDFKDGLGGKPYRLAAEREAGGEGLLGRLVRWRVTGARSAA
jgi:lipid II:glycine glycyltransferase (peptidoglycan interpeptide bridge formation enzyme)